jgi:DNA repair protein RecN (Recombination protein N)
VRARFEAQLAAIDAGEERLSALERALAQADESYVAAAATLSKGRRRAAKALDKAVQAELPPLRLERARFITEIATDESSRDAAGFDRIEFFAQTNPGTKPGPLMKVASGGELSRFMLALKVVLADKGSAPTLVFDEIDTGVGGAVADAIGQRLARLAERVQVVAVTHAPQVAARAARHFLIAKEPVAKSARVATRVAPLAPAPRQEEIARMLAGATVTDEARAAAARLLQAAG